MERFNRNPECVVHPERIVMATDLCDSNILLPLAIAQAKSNHARLTLVHALLDAVIPAFDAQMPVSPYGMDAEEFAERIMAKLVRSARAEGVDCESVVRRAVSASHIVREEVCRTDADRLIIGTHGRGRIGQMMLGSVAKDLLRSLDIPIFAVGPKVKTSQDFASPKRILCPVAVADHNVADAETLRKLAESYDAELILMHVISPETETEGHLAPDLDWAKEKLDALISDKTTMTVGLRTHVACGDVAGEILESASRFDADWIVLGRNEQRRAPTFAESVAYRIMATSYLPVMTLPHRATHTSAPAREVAEPACR